MSVMPLELKRDKLKLKLGGWRIMAISMQRKETAALNKTIQGLRDNLADKVLLALP